MSDLIISVRCPNLNSGCPHSDGPWREVKLTEIALGIIARPRLLCAGCDMELTEQTTDARPPEPLDGAFVRDRASGEMLRYHHGEWTAVPPDQSDAS